MQASGLRTGGDGCKRLRPRAVGRGVPPRSIQGMPATLQLGGITVRGMVRSVMELKTRPHAARGRHHHLKEEWSQQSGGDQHEPNGGTMKKARRSLLRTAMPYQGNSRAYDSDKAERDGPHSSRFQGVSTPSIAAIGGANTQPDKPPIGEVSARRSQMTASMRMISTRQKYAQDDPHSSNRRSRRKFALSAHQASP